MHGSLWSLPAACADSVAVTNNVAATMGSFISCFPLGCIPDDKKRAMTLRLLGERTKIKLHVRIDQIDAVVLLRRVSFLSRGMKNPPETGGFSQR